MRHRRAENQSGQVFVPANAGKFRPKNVVVKFGMNSIPCPDCKAETDQPCVTADGKPYLKGKGHQVRRRMAIRKHNQERGLG